MARPQSFPRYPARPHASKQARISIQGKTTYLGVYGSAESYKEYARLKDEWEAARKIGQATAPSPVPFAAAPVRQSTPRTVADLLARFWEYAEGKYRLPSGEPSSELANLRYALRPVALFYGHLKVGEFGPLALKDVRRKWIEGYEDPTHGARRPLTRKSIHRNLNRVRVVFAWAESEELVPASTVHRLRTVKSLEVGEFGVLESEDVGPVPDIDRRRTLRHVNPVVADMIRVQYLSGARPGEVCALRGRDIIRTGHIDLGGGTRLPLDGMWAVLPPWHKTRRKGHRRVILLGPKAQAVLAPYLARRPADAPVFSPVEAREARYAAMRAKRQTRVQPSQADRSKPVGELRRRIPEQFTVDAYDGHIARACENHGIRHWSAHMLRHSAATVLSEQFGPEIARIVLGHRTMDVTRIYARDNLAAATKAMREVG